MGQLNLLLPRTELKVGQSDGTCSHSLYLSLVPPPYAVRSTSCEGQYSIARTAELVSPVRDAGGQFAREQMLSRIALALTAAPD